MSLTLYQKYRPQTFEEVIGQDYIKEVLLKSIENNNVQGTYLFSGPRGTGKTSIAKIFARAINCSSNESPLNDDCEYCKYFESTNNYDDIFEIDAASNNGVDDIRLVIENVQYQPIHLKKKVYIIDEVHMLSKGAFNALLKTLEEPQENSIFILATTEPNKIPATILSRCQRLDFRRVSDYVMNNHLKNILEKEKIKYEEDIIPIITSISDGCVRDALSVLQKLVIASNDITLEYLQKSLGILEEKQYKDITEYLIKKDLKSLLLYWQEVYEAGVNIENFIVDYQYYLKELIIKEEKSYEIDKLLKIIYKINDIEQRAIYTKNLANLMEVCFIDIVSNLKPNPYTNDSSLLKADKSAINNKKPAEEIIILEEEQTHDQEIEEVVKEQTIDIKDPSESISAEENITFVSEEVCYGVLNKATKEARIMCTKHFTKVSDELTKNKKHGIAKFFLDSQIKAASEDELIVVIESDLVKPYLKRKTELLNNIPNINDVHIIDEKMWENVKKLYMNQQKEKKEKPQTVEINTDEKNIIEKLEQKLQVKVKTLEE